MARICAQRGQSAGLEVEAATAWPASSVYMAPAPNSAAFRVFSKLGSAALLPSVPLVKALSAESSQLGLGACHQALVIGLVPRRGGGTSPRGEPA